MPALDRLTMPAPAGPGQLPVVEGQLVVRAEGLFARIDGNAALVGPLIGGGDFADGTAILVCFSQDGRPWLVAPASGPPGPQGEPGPTGPAGPPGPVGKYATYRELSTNG